jgi:hypothetical protein
MTMPKADTDTTSLGRDNIWKRGHLNGLCRSLQTSGFLDLPSRKRKKTECKDRQTHAAHLCRPSEIGHKGLRNSHARSCVRLWCSSIQRTGIGYLVSAGRQLKKCVTYVSNTKTAGDFLDRTGRWCNCGPRGRLRGHHTSSTSVENAECTYKHGARKVSLLPRPVIFLLKYS